MTRQVFNRLVAMPPEELRFRALCEARKLEGRVRTAALTPVWRRSSLISTLTRQMTVPGWSASRRALEGEDFRAAHLALGRHFISRSSVFPVRAHELPDLVKVVLRAFPSAREDAVARAEQILSGRYDLLGYRGLELSASPDWHADPVHARRSPIAYWADVPFLDPATGDHKIIWELNRHQHWLVLGRAYALSGDRRFYRCFIAQLQSWLHANPPLLGTNWASMLELALRSLSWLWALEMFAGAAGPENEDPWIVDLLLALDRQLKHIEQNLSLYFSPNTHLTGEALALYVAGWALPELTASPRRVRIGRDVLIREAGRQILSDGGHAERSAHYHRYSTDFYLLAARVARRAGDTAAEIFENAVRVQARYLRAICDQNGIRPQLGDDDGGQLFPICGRSADDCRPTLGAAAALLQDGTFRVGVVPEEAYWLCGERAAAVPPETPSPASTAFTASGYYVSRTERGDHLVFDAGPHGFLNGGHAHDDALSCVLSIGRHPMFIDPGTATYTMDPEIRDRFRSTAMHNTLMLNGQSQSAPCGPFHWSAAADACLSLWRMNEDCDYAEGTNAAYAPNRHTRAILAVHGLGWWVIDHVLGSGIADIEINWHVHPRWTCRTTRERAVSLSAGSDALAIASTAPLTIALPGADPRAVWSPAYGVIEPAPVITARTTARLPTTIASFVPASGELANQLQIEELQPSAAAGDEWHSCAFRVRWSGGAMTWLSAIEVTGAPSAGMTSPTARWGTAEFQTDARVALLLDRARAKSEIILVNGAYAAAGGHQIVGSLGRVPLLRAVATSPAQNVHEVGRV